MNEKECGINNIICIDTNIAIEVLSWKQIYSETLLGKKVVISVVSELELLGYPKLTKEDEQKVNVFLKKCEIVQITDKIKYLTIFFRRNFTIKLPDAVILATAVWYWYAFLTNDKDLKNIYDKTK